MKPCPYTGGPDIELYFYGELDAAESARVERHLPGCPSCRAALDDLRTIRAALASPGLMVEAPAAGDWSGFTRRLDEACRLAGQNPGIPAAPRWRVRELVAYAATVAAIVTGLLLAGSRSAIAPPPTGVTASAASHQTPPSGASAVRALRAASAEHLDRSKLVVLDLAARDPGRTRPGDWQHERELAGSLLSDTRLYRLEAEDQGLTDVARVMRDLETVLLEASMSDPGDRESLERVQHLIERRDLVGKMQVVATSTTAGL